MRARLNLAILVPGGIGIHHHVPVLLDLLVRLSRSCDLRIYSFSDQEPHPDLQAPACTLVLPPPACRGTLMKAAWFLFRMWQDQARRPFDAVHGFWILPQGLLAVLAGRLLGLPSLVTLPGGDIAHLPALGYGSYSRPWNRWLIAWTLRQASHKVLLTGFQRALMEARALPLERTSIIPYGVDLEAFPFRPRALEAPLRLLFIGNLNRVKDPFTLVAAFHLLRSTRDCRLRVLGTDHLDGEARALARSLGVDEGIEWVGQVRHDQVPGELERAHVLLMTSRYEGQSVAVLEAYASGVPVVGTRVGLLADQPLDLTVEPGDGAGLARIVEELLGDPDRLSALRRSNRRFAEEHPAERTCRAYLDLYERFRGPSRV